MFTLQETKGASGVSTKDWILKYAQDDSDSDTDLEDHEPDVVCTVS